MRILWGFQRTPTLINYIKILSNKDYHLGQSMLNSVRTTGVSIVLIIIFSFIVGYILARVHFKLNRVLYIMFLMGMLIPYPFSAGSYLCSIPEMRNQQQMVHFASSICILWSSYRYFPGRGLCEIHSGITGRGCGN